AIVIGGRIAELELPGLAVAVLLADVQLIFAAGVGEVGDRLAVRRPRGIALGGVVGAREVADVPLLEWHGEDVAARFEHGPHAGRRNGRAGDRRRDLYRAWLQGREVRLHANV